MFLGSYDSGCFTVKYFGLFRVSWEEVREVQIWDCVVFQGVLATGPGKTTVGHKGLSWSGHREREGPELGPHYCVCIEWGVF